MEMTVSAPTKIGPYQLRGTIGVGAFSVVKLAFDEQKRFYMACKIVPKSRLATPELEERFEIEIKIFQQLNHPGIVTLYDLLKDDLNYYVFMEFCPNGELFQHIVDDGKLSEDEAKIVVYQMFSALDYIHSKGIAHRDLKPENLLLDEQGKVKISDFGLSKYVGNSGIANTPCGSPCYASPECVSGKPYNAITSDIWSSGVIIFAMLTGQLPWTKRNQAQLFQQIRRGEYSVPKYLSPPCQDFIRGLMTVDINKRLTIQQAFNHPWMKDVVESMGNKIEAEKRPPYVSTKKIERFFSSDAAEPLGITDQQIWRNLSYRPAYFATVSRSLRTKKDKSLPPISNDKRKPSAAKMPSITAPKPLAAAKKVPHISKHASQTGKALSSLYYAQLKNPTIPKVKKSNI